MNGHLRPFTLDDLPLLEEWIRVGDLTHFMSRWQPRSSSLGIWNPDLTRWHLIVVEDRDIGTIWLERDSVADRVCDLGILIFDPEYRGRGIGAGAIHCAEQEVADHWKIDRVRLRVRASNPRAISCYRKCGYQISAITDKEIGGEAATILHMEHRLQGREE